MLKLKYKLQYAIDIGIDFVLRNIENDILLNFPSQLFKYFLGILSVSENIVDFSDKRFKRALGKILSRSQKNGNKIFILDENNKISDQLTSLAAIIFHNSGFKNLFSGFCNTLQVASTDKDAIKTIEQNINFEDLVIDSELSNERIEELLLNQVGPSDSILGGSFCDDFGVPQLDLTYKYLKTFKRFLLLV